MIRAVIDTNVFISAAINVRGTPGRVVDLWQADAFELVSSTALLLEIERAILHPRLTRHGVTSEQGTRFVEIVRETCTLVAGKLRVTGVCRDPDDNEVLACALEGKADYIVTGDDDLLALGEYEGIVILSPTAFLAALAIAAPEETL
jgi:putative PIN family toxin of toxin-antitoxin system